MTISMRLTNYCIGCKFEYSCNVDYENIEDCCNRNCGGFMVNSPEKRIRKMEEIHGEGILSRRIKEDEHELRWMERLIYALRKKERKEGRKTMLNDPGAYNLYTDNFKKVNKIFGLTNCCKACLFEEICTIDEENIKDCFHYNSPRFKHYTEKYISDITKKICKKRG